MVLYSLLTSFNALIQLLYRVIQLIFWDVTRVWEISIKGSGDSICDRAEFRGQYTHSREFRGRYTH